MRGKSEPGGKTETMDRIESKRSEAGLTMSKSMRLVLALACLSPLLAGPLTAQDTVLPRLAAALEGKWVADKDDNICGISDLRKISNPGVVDYDELWDATPEIKKLKKEGIDPDSAEGKALRNKAKTRITKACQKIQGEKGLCGVWKKISHTGSKQATDITSSVKKLF